MPTSRYSFSFKFGEREAAIVLLVFHFVGILGLTGAFKSWFVLLTPLNLLLSMFCLLALQSRKNKQFLGFALFCFILGFGAEWIGVHTGWLFGSYHYGPVLGYKLDGIPLLIGLNWLMLTIVSGNFCRRFIKQGTVSVFAAALLMTLIDYLIEPVAIQLNFWTWHSTTVPLYNYVCWFLVALPMQWLYHKWVSPNNPAAKWLLLSQVLFFAILNYIL
jgi:putative membrane protein